MILGYVITAQDKDVENNAIQFYAKDIQSGGYPYWTTRITNAEVFKTEGEALQTFNCKYLDETEVNIMTSGIIYPTNMIQGATGLCNTKRKGTSTIAVAPLELISNVASKKVTCEIKQPTGFTYD